jgi:selT/selW/selH-like putative selenoprotein
MAGPSTATTAGRLPVLLIVGALVLGMDVLSTVVTPPLPPVAASASASASASAGAAGSAGAAAKAAAPKKRAMPGGLHVSLCTACSYKGYYSQLAAELQDKFPGIEASASPYPASTARRAVAAGANVAQGVALAVVLGGDRLFPAIGVDPPPAWYTEKVVPRKTAAAIACWFFPSLARSSAEATGAFEVFFEGKPLFSKLALGRFPSADELAVAIEKRVVAQEKGAGYAAAAGAAGATGAAGAGARGGGGSDGEL